MATESYGEALRAPSARLAARTPHPALRATFSRKGRREPAVVPPNCVARRLSAPRAETESKASRRVDAIDCTRGLALVGMAVYHLSWDLADFGFVPPLLPFSPPMRLLSHVVASAFLALVGVSLALAHRNGLNPRAFWRRIAVVAGAAALVSAGSYAFAPGQAIWFGILHCIVAASLLALPLIGAPAAASLAAGAVAIAAPALFRSTLFDSPALLWTGLGEALPNTLDWRPLLPWGGIVLLGIGAARLPGVLGRLMSPDRWRARSGPARALAFAGRHSLAIYLIHQPILIGLVAGIAHLGLVPTATPRPDPEAFLSSCRQACMAKGTSEDECEGSCRCVADVIERSGEGAGATPLDPARQADLKRMIEACAGR